MGLTRDGGGFDPAAVTAAVNALIDGAPGALDTLNELAAAMNDDASFAATITTALAGKQPVRKKTGYRVVGSGAPTTLTSTLGDLYLLPRWLPAGTLDKIGVMLQTAQASTVCRLGLYASDAQGLPTGAPLFDTTADTSSGAAVVKQPSSDPSVVITDGLYYFAAATQGGTTQPTLYAFSCDRDVTLQSEMYYSSMVTNLFAANIVGYKIASVTGALPTNPSTVSTNLHGANAPRIGFRIS